MEQGPCADDFLVRMAPLDQRSSVVRYSARRPLCHWGGAPAIQEQFLYLGRFRCVFCCLCTDFCPDRVGWECLHIFVSTPSLPSPVGYRSVSETLSNLHA